MSAEQVVYDFLSSLETRGMQPAATYLADNMKFTSVDPVVDGGRHEYIGQTMLLLEAIPDFRWGVENVTKQGNQFTVTMRWTGHQTGTYHLSMFLQGGQ